MFRGILRGLAVLLACGPGLALAEMRAFEADDNLVVTHDLKCLALDAVEADYTPADMVAAIYDCTRANRFDDAFLLRTAMFAFVVFDRERVADRSAAQAQKVLNLMLQDALREDMPEILEAYNVYSADRFDRGPLSPQDCGTLLVAGPPEYHPTYMIQHGIKAFTGGNEEPLIAGFDPQERWPWILREVLGCD